MGKYIDISVNVAPDEIPVWPGAPKAEFRRRLSLEDGDGVTDTNILLNVHTGTHVDAPAHFVQAGQTVDHIPLDKLIGPAVVVDLRHVTAIDAKTLDSLALPPGTYRILFRTSNSQLWRAYGSSFHEDFVALTADAAEWIVARGVGLVGIDYLSIQGFHDGPEAHQVLLQAGIVIVEGLNLEDAGPGEYELICLPMKLKGLEAAPARVIIVQD